MPDLAGIRVVDHRIAAGLILGLGVLLISHVAGVRT
jgi:hypothetical protein